MSNHEDTDDPLETSLLQDDLLELDDEAKAYVQWMNSFEVNRKKKNTMSLLEQVGTNRYHLSRRHHSLNRNIYLSIFGTHILGTLLCCQSSSQHH